MPKLILMKPGEASSEIACRLQKAGFKREDILEWPAYEFKLPQKFDSEEFKTFASEAVVVVVSPTAARCLKKLIPQLPASTRFATVGHPTAVIVRKLFNPDTPVLYPDGSVIKSGSERLLELFLSSGLPSKVLIARGQTGRELLYSELINHGVKVKKVVVYERIPLQLTEADKSCLPQEEELHVLLTSSDAVEILWKNLGFRYNESLKKAFFYTIHERIKEKLEEKGAKNIFLFDTEREDFVDLICSKKKFFQN